MKRLRITWRPILTEVWTVSDASFSPLVDVIIQLVDTFQQGGIVYDDQ